MSAALRAEWLKIRTVPDLAILLVLTVASTLGVSWVSAALGGASDPAHAGLLGVQVGQAVAALVGVQAVAGEFGTGLIGVTLLALPRRSQVLAAKAAWLGALVGVAAVVAVLGSLAIGHSLLAFPLHGVVWRAVALSVLHLILIAFLGLGIGTAVRNGAAAAGGVLGILYLTPVILPMFPDQHLQRMLYRLTPATAVEALQSTVGTSGLPLSPWEALGVVALWTAGAVAIGASTLTRRDVNGAGL